MGDAIVNMATQPGAIKKLWWGWKSLRLPWRKRWLVGFDLAGNTFWEFKDALNAGRLRRIVQYGRKTYYSDVNVSPQWMQWLRHTRHEPPSINEQQLDEIRRAQMKQLAAQADARWASKPSALDKQADRHQLPSAHPPPEATPKDFAHQAQVQETVGEVAADLAKETPMERQQGPPPPGEAPPQDTFSEEPAKKPSKEFKGYSLGRQGEQQPMSWSPKAARRRS